MCTVSQIEICVKQMQHFMCLPNHFSDHNPTKIGDKYSASGVKLCVCIAHRTNNNSDNDDDDDEPRRRSKRILTA